MSDTFIDTYVPGLVWNRSILVGAFCGARLVGLSEAVFDADWWPFRAEFAVSVARPLRGRDLGRCLVDRADEQTAAYGSSQSRFTFLPDNRPVVDMLRALGSVDWTDCTGVLPARAERPLIGL